MAGIHTIRIRICNIMYVYGYNKSMPRKESYLNSEELAYVNSKPKGFVRSLIQKDMASVPVYTRLEAQTVPYKERDGLELIAKERAKGNPNACRKCGRIKVAGKCLVCKK